MTTALAEAVLPADVARVMIGQGLEVAEAVSGLIGVVNGDELRVIERRTSRRAEGDVMPTIALDADTPLAEALRRREPVWLESRERFRELFPAAHDRLPLDADATAFLAMPLMHGDELVGGLVLGFSAASALGATDRTFAQLLAQSAGSALARARTFERERDGRREAEMMVRARQDVLGVVAHDLRNPLSVVGSVVEMLAELDLAAPEREKTAGRREEGGRSNESADRRPARRHAHRRRPSVARDGRALRVECVGARRGERSVSRGGARHHRRDWTRRRTATGARRPWTTRSGARESARQRDQVLTG